MKKKSLVISLILFVLGLSSCGPTPLEETPDGYIDVLPSTSKSAIILHAFDWSFSQIEENLSAIAEAGYKVVQTSPVQQPKGGGGSWWSMYQPVSFSIAANSPLGTKDDLTSLCETAEAFGIDIICDIVFNHMATVSSTSVENDGTPTVSPEVADYESYIYEHRNDNGSSATFHHNPNAAGSGAVTQVYSYGNLPDLNTSNAYVQGRCLSLLKECIDVGVDGFRFDAAKHIETPNDPQYSSDFWPNVLGEAKTYYEGKNDGKKLLAYGEILNEPDGGRSIDLYTPYMKVTDNSYITRVISGSSKADAATVLSAAYGKNTTPDHLVSWVESHDTYINSTNRSGEMRTAQRWAVLASRKDLTPLFFARPNDSLIVGSVGSYHFENKTIAVINRFHNRFIGYEEYLSAEGSVFVNERYDENIGGAVVVDFSLKGTKTVNFSHLPTGVYYNQMNGDPITVKNNKAQITFDSTGIVILTMSKHLARPTIEVSTLAGIDFVGSLDVDIEVTNAETSSYQINNETPVNFTASASITLGDIVDENDQIALTVRAINGEFTITKTFVYTRITLVDETKFNVVNLNSSYYTDYELYYWAWPPSGSGSSIWSKNYTIQSGVLLIDFAVGTNYVGFLLAIFPKGYVITNLTAWDSNAIKQTGDITITDGFYNASNF